MFNPNLKSLPPAQQILWGSFETTPNAFVLYGGTVLAVRRAQRASFDFYFFSNKAFAAGGRSKWNISLA
jgi:hypothetical protein